MTDSDVYSTLPKEKIRGGNHQIIYLKQTFLELKNITSDLKDQQAKRKKIKGEKRESLFHGGAVVKILPFSAEVTGSIPCRGAKIPT